MSTVFPRIVSALEYFPPLNSFRTCMYCDQRSHYIRLNSKKNNFHGIYSRKYGKSIFLKLLTLLDLKPFILIRQKLKYQKVFSFANVKCFSHLIWKYIFNIIFIIYLWQQLRDKCPAHYKLWWLRFRFFHRFGDFLYFKFSFCLSCLSQ